MRRRGLPLLAVALAGLLLGAWLAWPEPLPAPAPPPTARRAAAPAPPSPAEDTGLAPAQPPLPSPTAGAAPPAATPPTVLDRLPTGTVRCPVKGGGQVERFTVMLMPTPELVEALATQAHEEGMEGDARVGLHAPLPGRVEGEALVFEVPTTASTVFIEGQQRGASGFFEEMQIRWRGDQGRCAEPLTLAPHHAVRIAGRVRGLLDGEKATVLACRNSAATDAAGRFDITTTAPEGTCRVLAWRRDGALRAYSDMVDVEVKGDTRVEDLVLVLPEEDVGGMGARIEPVEGGMLLVDLQDGGPGARAGLMNGEIVTAVDGESLAGMSIDEAIATITGPVDSHAVLTVVDPDGQERDVELLRGWVEAAE